MNKLNVTAIFSEAWAKVHGAKMPILIASVIMMAILAVLIIAQLFSTNVPILYNTLNFITNLAQMLLNAGLIYMGIQRAQNLPITYTQVFYSFKGNIFINLLVLFFVEALIALIPIFIALALAIFLTPHVPNMLVQLINILGFIAAFYLMIRMLLATAYVLDAKINFIQALKASFRATRGHVLPLIAIILFQILVFIAGFIALGIGLIWALPFCYICYGVVYKKLAQPVRR